ncbi:MAG: ABC transporter ATP-binding protein, partial [Bilifractor sp.]
MILVCRHIYKTYIQGKLEVPVLRDVNFSMDEGEYVAIMGPSGSGKSTLMNLIGALDKPTSGELILDGKDVARLSDNALADLRLEKIGFVFQNFQLLPYMTALENVELPLTYAGLPKKKRRELASEALERVGLGERLDFKPGQLSGGQKQRTAIARAIANHPKIILADEPTGALDSKSGRQVMDLFEELNRSGSTIL